MKVGEIMQREVVTVTPEMSLAQVQRLMHDKQIRHVPVVADARLLGMVTDRDIREAVPSPATTLSRGEIRYQMDTIPISTCMTREVVTLHPDDAIVQASRILTARKFGGVPVVKDERLVGIITEIDCLRALLQSIETPRQSHGPGMPTITLQARGAERGRPLVKDAMQTPMITVAPEDLVSTAYNRMQGGRIRHLPVVDEADVVVGIVTDRDIRRASASDDADLAAHELMYLLERVSVQDVMTMSVHTVRGDTSLAEATRLFLTHKFGCLPVTRDNGTLLGMLTVTDLLRLDVERHDTTDRDATR